MAKLYLYKSNKKITEFLLEGVYNKKISIFTKALILDIILTLQHLERERERERERGLLT
jgi:hypothetical protein